MGWVWGLEVHTITKIKRIRRKKTSKRDNWIKHPWLSVLQCGNLRSLSETKRVLNVLLQYFNYCMISNVRGTCQLNSCLQESFATLLFKKKMKLLTCFLFYHIFSDSQHIKHSLKRHFRHQTQGRVSSSERTKMIVFWTIELSMMKLDQCQNAFIHVKCARQLDSFEKK